MATHTVTVTDGQFQAEVLDAKHPVLVDFWATWCAPCKTMEPALEALATQYAGRATIAKLNIKDNQLVPQQWGIRSVPNLLVFKGGKVVGQIASAVSKAKLEELLLKAL
jgi:thioredoxin 1